MTKEIKSKVIQILGGFNPLMPEETADSLRDLWLQYEPKSIDGIKAEERQKQETVGIPVPVLKAIGKELARSAKKRVHDFIPFTRLLWESYGREGRVVGLIPLGAMELVAPTEIMPMLMEMCRTCYTWEDADRLAMDAVEPIVRKKPGEWLDAMDGWISDDNKWVRRAGVTVVGRLPMKHAAYSERCLEMIEPLLWDEEEVVKKSVSFAIRLTARGDVNAVALFLSRHVPPDDPRSTWVLCDTIRSMGKQFLPALRDLLPDYEAWLDDPDLDSRNRRSIESAVRTLQKVS
jgi:3-methyladenine DNA glycosylase AlkD